MAQTALRWDSMSLLMAHMLCYSVSTIQSILTASSWFGLSLQVAACDTMLHAGRLPCLSRHIVCQAGQSSCEQPDISLLAAHLQQQWDSAANAHLGGVVIKPYSNRSVCWVCDQCPDGHVHQWQAAVSDRSRGTGCSQCAGKKVCQHNSLATKAPDVARYWNYSRNKSKPDTVLAHSNTQVEWSCDVCGHEWTASPNARVTGSHGCAECNAGGRPLADGTKPPSSTPPLHNASIPFLQSGIISAMKLRASCPATLR